MSRQIVTVLGAGSWGKALARILNQKDLEVRLWGRSLKALQGLTLLAENGINLPDVTLEPDIKLALQNADWIVMALPSAAVTELAQKVAPLLESRTRIASGTKGLHPQNGLRPSQLWEQAGVPLKKFVSFSGPNLAKEIVAGVPTSMVVASPDEDATRGAQQLLAFPNLRVYRNTDLIGVELGGALKNVVAIAAGICDGLGFGDNTKAALITRGWSEMTRLALKLGARQETLYGLSGMGDLIATCASTQSRNHSIGELLGKGFSLQDAQQKIGHVAEGVYTTLAALQLAKEQKVELPITWQLKKVLFEGYNAGEAVAQLMSRPERNELE